MLTQSKSLILACFLFTACTGGGGPSNSNLAPANDPHSGQSVNKASTQAAINCGDKSCNTDSEYCYQEVKGAKLINLSQCGDLPGSPCEIWQKDIGDGRTVVSECRPVIQNGDCNSIARDAVQAHSRICTDSIGCEIKAYCSDRFAVISCFDKD